MHQKHVILFHNTNSVIIFIMTQILISKGDIAWPLCFLWHYRSITTQTNSQTVIDTTDHPIPHIGYAGVG